MEIKSFMTYAAHTATKDDASNEDLANSIKQFEESRETAYPLYESANKSIFSELSEGDLAHLRYTLYVLPTVLPALFSDIRESLKLEPPEKVSKKLLWRKIRQYTPDGGDLSPSARRLIADILREFGPALRMGNAIIHFLQTYRMITCTCQSPTSRTSPSFGCCDCCPHTSMTLNVPLVVDHDEELDEDASDSEEKAGDHTDPEEDKVIREEIGKHHSWLHKVTEATLYPATD
jgi:hypothetical protein